MVKSMEWTMDAFNRGRTPGTEPVFHVWVKLAPISISSCLNGAFVSKYIYTQKDDIYEINFLGSLLINLIL
jgi:hypothetical protein